MNTTVITRWQEKEPAALRVVPVIQSEREAVLARVAELIGISPAQLQEDFRGKENEILLLYPGGEGASAIRVALLGLGEKPQPQTVRSAFRRLVHQHRRQAAPSVVLDFSTWSGETPAGQPPLDVIIRAAVEGCHLGAHRPNFYKTRSGEDENISPPERLLCLVNQEHQAIARTAVKEGEILSDVLRKVMELVDAPSNRVTPEVLAETARKSGQLYGFTVEVWDREEIERRGFGGLLAVAQGSTVPPTFTLMEYRPVGARKQSLLRVGLVGKGVTFDTGGISLKSRDNLHLLKDDMAGAAAVLGIVEAAARLKLPVHLIGAIPATENKPDGSAVNPGDVITTYSGQTVEIIDTDAEGRLILADGLAYVAKNYQPDVLLDLATLTGAIMVALGQEAAGLFANNDDLAAALAQAGERCGERVWRMPLWEEYARQIESDVADVKNWGGRGGGAVTAAKFLEKFINGHPAWGHLDIAGVSLADSDFTKDKSATGFGVRLVVEYLKQLIR
ncbi:MAG: leucyl aminopeptidase [Calditrichaeota bacterium]|nr:MAG: leucyl aminopeptidase [Calditrichota bacterium]